jgi:alkylated DNA repair dioxygenase AlkB
MLSKLLDCLGLLFRFDGQLEAGIVNYYTCKSRLNPHSDNREPNTSASLFSLSLGQPALFLLGGAQRYDRPVLPLLLRDGDLMIMGGSSRVAFHSMNRLICDDCECNRKSIKRININARQVF